MQFSRYSFGLNYLNPLGLSGLEPPTSRLSGVRSNRLSYKPLFFKGFGSHLLSHTVSSAVPSAAWVLTVVFGMGTGVSPKRIATRNVRVTKVSAQPDLKSCWKLASIRLFKFGCICDVVATEEACFRGALTYLITQQ